MKTKITCLFLMIFCGLAVNAQEQNGRKTVERVHDVYRDVDVMASYYGGYQVVLKKIEEATKHCKKGSFNGKDSTIIIDVLITDKGKVAKVDFVKADVSLCNNEIRKAIETADQWKPARINNKPVNSYLQLTVNLKNDYNGNNKNAVNRLQ